jgi:sulfite exporter TauE/SafE
MSSELQLLILTAIGISFLHTILGPDHYLPFIALSKARGWSLSRTIFWTIICGCGHVWSSVLLGLGGAALGWSLTKIDGLESLRGGIAAWSLLVFGIAYLLWGLIRANRNRRHKHFDISGNEIYVYEHKHGEMVAPRERHAVTPWVMFLIFLLGPCEPMIPLLYFPAATSSFSNMLLLVIVYTLFTLLTMLVMVLLGYYGISFIKTEKLEKHIHTLGGLTITICGAGMVFMDW